MVCVCPWYMSVGVDLWCKLVHACREGFIVGRIFGLYKDMKLVAAARSETE